MSYSDRRRPPAILLACLFGWYLLVFVLPFIFIVKISLASIADGIPPYTPFFGGKNGMEVAATTANYAYILHNKIFLDAYVESLKLAATTTLFCILLGYPIAWAIAQSDRSIRPILLVLITIPFWTSLLTRIYAWIGLLKDNGLINGALLELGIISHPVTMLYTPFSVYFVMIYCYLPFFILPLYAVIEKTDQDLIAAAQDLGAGYYTAHALVTLPLSLPGVIAGGLLVFVPAIGTFLVPRLTGGAVNITISSVLWDYFFVARDWPTAATASVLLLAIMALPLILIVFIRRLRAEVRQS